MRHRFVTTTAALLSLLVLWVVGAELGTLRPTDEVATPGEVADFAAPLIGLAAQQGSNYAERVASGVAIAGTNYTDAAIQAILPVAMTNWQASVNALTNGAALGATALQPSWAETGTVFRATEVTGAQSTLIATAWQNPASAVDWTWTSNGREITLTGYSGPNAVVIPDMLDGLPVTGFGDIFRGNIHITSIGGGANIKAVGGYAFYRCGNLNSISLPACTTVGAAAFRDCVSLNSVSLPACTTVGDGAFYSCGNLNSVSLPACTTVGASVFAVCENLSSVFLPACTTVGNYAFYSCGNLNSVFLPACTTVGAGAFYGCGYLSSVSLPACTTVGDSAFYNCGALNSVTFGQNAPAQTANVFEDSTPTIYVSNPHATGWGDTWNGRPVVRAASMPDIASHNTNATAHADIRGEIVSATNAVMQVWMDGTNSYMVVSNKVLTVYAESNSVPVQIWSSTESSGGIDQGVINDIYKAIYDVELLVADKAPKAWGDYAPDGSANPDPSYMVLLNRPLTMHTSGFQWSTYGEIAVLTGSGEVAYETGGDGSIRWGLDIHTNFIQMVRGDSVTIGANATKCKLVAGELQIVYPYVGDAFPILQHTPDLLMPFDLYEGATWEDNEDGTATAYVPATGLSGFFKATTTHKVGAYVDIGPVVRFRDGIQGSDQQLPVVYDSTITINVGGTNYRIPAERVQ